MESSEDLFYLWLEREARASVRMSKEGEGTIAIDGPVYIIKNDEQPETD
jgi:hypothetical protein